MLPMSLFSDIFNVCKEHNFPIDEGTKPLRMFPWISRGVSLPRRVIEVGTRPVNLFLKTFKTLRYLILPKISGMLFPIIQKMQCLVIVDISQRRRDRTAEIVTGENELLQMLEPKGAHAMCAAF